MSTSTVSCAQYVTTSVGHLVEDDKIMSNLRPHFLLVNRF